MIRVIGDRVLVALPPDPENTVTASGLVLVRDPDAARTPTQGLVIELGEKSGTIDLQVARQAVADALVPLYGETMDTIEDAIDTALSELKPAAFDVALGDCVLFPIGAGEEVHFEGVRYVLLRESEIIGVVEPTETHVLQESA